MRDIDVYKRQVRGMLVHTEPNLAVIECGGVAFKCFTTTQTLSLIHICSRMQRLNRRWNS